MRTRLPHTPFLDAWRADLAAATAARGTKADLARHLAAARGQDPRVWTVNLARILAGRTIPNGEDVLAINHYLAARTATPSSLKSQISNLKSKSPHHHPATPPTAQANTGLAATRPHKRNYS
jgi:hypothetical protein